MAELTTGLATLVATMGKAFKELSPNLEDQIPLLQAMATEPKLLKRPLLWKGNHLLVGFDESKYKELLQNEC